MPENERQTITTFPDASRVAISDATLPSARVRDTPPGCICNSYFFVAMRSMNSGNFDQNCATETGSSEPTVFSTIMWPAYSSLWDSSMPIAPKPDFRSILLRGERPEVGPTGRDGSGEHGFGTSHDLASYRVCGCSVTNETANVVVKY